MDPVNANAEVGSRKISSSHDPACDQCRIKKIGCGREFPICHNCLKSKAECAWSNKGKRPSQTKKLVNDFEQFGSRLDGLQRNVALIHDRLEDLLRRLPSQQAEDSDRPVSTHREYEDKDLMGAATDTQSMDMIIKYGRCGDGHDQNGVNGHFTWSSNGTERLCGRSSLLSLFSDADEQINRRLENMRPKDSLRDILSRGGSGGQKGLGLPPPPWDTFLAYKADIYRELSLSTQQHHADLSCDGSAPLLPPRLLLDPIVEPYFRHISPVSPILARESTFRAIEQCYSPGVEPVEPAWIIIFNYIIIRCFIGRYMPLERPSSDVDLVSSSHFERPFIANVRRAFGQLDKLLALKLVNVQALMSLTLISQKYFSENVTEYLLNQACYVAKSMGLHRQGNPPGDLTPAEIDERRQVFWGVFTVDKDLSLLLGSPPNFHHYDCDVPVPEQATSDFLRRIDASIILDKVYVALYSSAAGRAPAADRESAIAELAGDLDGFLGRIERIPLGETNSRHRARHFLILEHKYTLHHTRLMVLGASRDPAKRLECLQEARNCVKTVARIRVARTTVGGFMVLRRPFQWRPFAPFFELFPSIFTYPLSRTQLDDLALMREMVDMLRDVAGQDGRSTYCGKLLHIAMGCIHIADEFVQRCLAHQGGSVMIPSSGHDTQEGLGEQVREGRHRKRKGSPMDDGLGQLRAAKASRPFTMSPPSLDRVPPAGNVELGQPSLTEGLVATHHLQASASVAPSTIQPAYATPAATGELTGFMDVGYDNLGGGGLLDMFFGWPRAGADDDLSFVADGTVWGEEEIMISPQQHAGDGTM